MTASVEEGQTRLDLPVSNLYAPGDESSSFVSGQEWEMTHRPSISSSHRGPPPLYDYPSEMIDPRRPRNYHR
jgi:hypothetical protein